MSKLLILTSDINLRALLNLIIREDFDIEIINKGSAATAIEYIRKNNDVKGVVADENFPSSGATKINKEVANSDHVIPVVALMDPSGKAVQKDASFFYKVSKDEIKSKLPDTLGEIFKRRTAEQSLSGHIPLDLDILLNLNNIGADCYIKLGAEKYIKILNKKDYFCLDDYEKYKKKGVESFFIKHDDVTPLIEFLSSNLQTMLDLSLYGDPSSLSKMRSAFTEEEDIQILDNIVDALNKAEKHKINFEEASKASSETLNLIRKANAKFGDKKDVQNLAKATVLLAMSTISQAPELNELLSNASDSDDTYLNDHSVLLANVNCQIANMMGWNSTLTHYKLTLAALLHDIALNNSKLSRYRGIPDLMIDAENYKEEEIKSFLGHTEQAAEIIRNFRMIPPDTDLIVSQHHERPDGTGFPAKIGHAQIAPLAALFIIGHDLVSFILNKGKNPGTDKKEWNVVSFLNQHRFMYQSGVFKDIFTAMWKQMINSK